MDSLNTRRTLRTQDREYDYCSLRALEGRAAVDSMPFTLRVLLENLLRGEDGRTVTRHDIEALLDWRASARQGREIQFLPTRVLLQDFTGVPALVDLAAMRQTVRAWGGDPRRVNPLCPVDLVVDHSVQVDSFGTREACDRNVALEYGRNRERYAFLRWGQQAFGNLRVAPPGTGIVHQVNMELLADVVSTRAQAGGGREMACFDTLVGTDSHTTMVNGMGVLGWGVGGIEAEACMLGQPVSMCIPEVVGVRLTGALPDGVTATDAVLTLTRMLRHRGVVGKLVEFFGPGVRALSLADRAVIANMCPEYGATAGFFPVDGRTLDYLRLTGRPASRVALVADYLAAQGLFYGADTPDPSYGDTMELDLASVGRSLAGPRLPEQLMGLGQAREGWQGYLREQGRSGPVPGTETLPGDGAVVIAAITSCTNTANPELMLAAGLLARKAVERGLKVKPWVKTSLAPGSQAVTRYLARAGLDGALEALGFYLVGYGCTTCIGNSGPLIPEVAARVREQRLLVCSVLSGNRNFEGRINPLVAANYLMSPPLVVAYALAGTLEADLETAPLGAGADGRPVYLREVWPTRAELDAARAAVDPSVFEGADLSGDARWKGVEFPRGETFAWDEASTYIRRPPYFDGLEARPRPVEDVAGARVLALLGDHVTTDHISPAGSIEAESPAGRYLGRHGVEACDFNAYGARRGNHEVMMRGTLANIRLKNRLVPGVEGGMTRHFPSGEPMSIYEAAQRYREEGVPLIIVAGREYGTGSSRDWAAKGPALLGVRAVIARSFERIHRSNLIGMGVLPLQFADGAAPAWLSGQEVFNIAGIGLDLAVGKKLSVTARLPGGELESFEVVARLDTALELAYYRHGGILPYVLRQMVGAGE